MTDRIPERTLVIMTNGEGSMMTSTSVVSAAQREGSGVRVVSSSIA
jgi:hypothetical protein